MIARGGTRSRIRLTANVIALLGDTAVEDTHGVDRVTGAIRRRRRSVDAEADAGSEMLTGTTACAGTGTVDISVKTSGRPR